MKPLAMVFCALVLSTAMADTRWAYKKTVPTWWYESVTNWNPQAFPTESAVIMGDWSMGGTVVYLQDGDAVSGISDLRIAHDWTTGEFSLQLRAGSSLTQTGRLYAGGNGVQCSGFVTVSNATLTIGNGIQIGGGTWNSGEAIRPIGYGRLQILDKGVVKVTGSVKIGKANDNPASNVNLTGPVGRFDLEDSDYQMTSWGSTEIGTTGDGTKYASRVPFNVLRSTFRTGAMSVNGTADALFRDSAILRPTADWSERESQLVMYGHASQTNNCVVTNSTLVLYCQEWEDRKSDSGKFWGRWRKIRFASQGYSEIAQIDSVVTNVGIWFWPTENAGNVYPLKPSKYIVKGGELHVVNSVNYGDRLKGHPNGEASCGFAAATNAPNSGTISLVDAPIVSYPRVCTNLLLAGAGPDADDSRWPRVFGVTAYRPHFEFVLTRKGHRAMEIREQTDVLGMFSFVPQGGLQVVQTNRFPLIRHKTASTTLTTLEEPQFRAPNAALWTTGGFADTPCEWGVTLKSAAEIANGADLGAGVTCGMLKIPGKWRDELKSGTVRLKMAPRAKTLAEIAAGLTAAGYPASVENTDEVVVDLKSSGMLKPGRDNRILFDFTEPPDAIQVRDRVVTTNAVVLGVAAEYARSGLAVVVK